MASLRIPQELLMSQQKLDQLVFSRKTLKIKFSLRRHRQTSPKLLNNNLQKQQKKQQKKSYFRVY